MSNASHFILFNDIKNLIMNKYRTMPEEILIFRLSACILTTIILIHTKNFYIYVHLFLKHHRIYYSFIQFQFILHHSLHPTSLHKILPKARNSTVRWGGERQKKERKSEREKLSNGKLDVYIWDVMWKVHEKIALSNFHVFS